MTRDARALGVRLLQLPYVLSARLNNAEATGLEIETHAPDLFYTQFPDIVLEYGFEVTRFESPDNNLESVFKYLVNG